MPTALILVDIQNDYFPGGAMELVGSEDAAYKAGELLQAFREKALAVVHIQHVSTRDGASFFLPGTKGVEFYHTVEPLPTEVVVVKHYPNSFRETVLARHLHGLGINNLVFAGMMTHMCIDTTIRAAADLGFNCTLAHDACATLDLFFDGKTVAAQNVQGAFMGALNNMFAKVLRTNQILGEL